MNGLRRGFSCAAVLALALGSASCGAMHHEHMFPMDRPVEAAKAPPLPGKRVALDLAKTQDSLTTDTNGHSFHVFGIRAYFERFLKVYLGEDRIVADPAAADNLLALELRVELSSALFGTTGTAKATCRILDPKGTVLGEGAGTGESSFGSMANGGPNCEMAALTAVAAAVDAAFAKLK